MGGEVFFDSAHCEYTAVWLFCDGLASGSWAGTAGAAQYRTSASVSMAKKQALKLKSQSKMEQHRSSVFRADRPLHCDADKRHPSSTSGD